MTDFFLALRNPDIVFLRYALGAGLLASIAFGIMGSFVVARRISYIAGAISHSVLGGIGAGLYCRTVLGWSWMHPMMGAVIAALASAVIIGMVSLHAREREDTVIGAIWAVGMATGLLFLAKTPGYTDPMSYLFGNILLITAMDLVLVAVLIGVIVLATILLYNRFLAVCFDEEFAGLRGIHVQAYYIFLLCLTALAIVMLVRIVGIVMVIALITIPPAIAGHFSRSLWQMMILASLLCMAFTSSGLMVSYVHDLPTGPVIIMIAGVTFILAAMIRNLRIRFRH